MGIIALDPTLFVDKLTEMLEDPRYEFISLTGIEKIDKVSLYSIVLESLDGTGLRYGYQVSENFVVIATEDLKDYIEELTASIVDVTGIDYIDIVDTVAPEEDFALGEDSYLDGIHIPIEDESEVFDRYSSGSSESTHTILNDFLQAVLEESIRILTGGYKEIEEQVLML